VRDVQLLNGRIESKDDVFLEGFGCGIIDHIMGKIEVEDGACHFEQLNEKLGTELTHYYLASLILFLARLI
jgi:hypothetical protein